MKKAGVILSLMLLLTGCIVTPKPISVKERYEQAQTDLRRLFVEQDSACQQLDFYEALARGLKYNLDFRIKLANIALQADQLKVAAFTMFPALNASGSDYTRDNNFSSFGITTAGNPTDVLNSTPRTLQTARAGLAWNILDFGLGYVRSRQQAERILVAQEESRKQLQQLSQDVLTAYWNAYTAQELVKDSEEFQEILTQAKNRLAIAVRDNTVPQENLLNYQATLLEGSRRLIQLKYKYDKAMIDLKHLVSLPLEQKFILAPPPAALRHAQNIASVNFKKLDALTLINRPELASQNYQKRIAAWGVNIVVLQALPGITLNYGWNYNSNKYLVNNYWLDKSVDVAWNLLNLASLPSSYQAAKTQVCYEKLKSMALTLTVLTETRYAFSHYQTLSEEYAIVHKQTETADALFRLIKNRQLASLASTQQVILAKLRTITAKMDENLLLSDLSTALGELYLSMGVDLLPLDIQNKSLPQVIQLISQRYALQNADNFLGYTDAAYEKIFGPDQPYTLQLFGCYSLRKINQLQNKYSIQQASRYGVKKIHGRDMYVLTYGKYHSPETARLAIAALPKPLQNLTPWVIKTAELNWLA